MFLVPSLNHFPLIPFFLFFSLCQVSRYADVYASTLLNLIYYPFSYMFRAPSMLMPHESTVTHEQVFQVKDAPVSTMSRAQSVQQDIFAGKNPKVKSSLGIQSTMKKILHLNRMKFHYELLFVQEFILSQGKLLRDN